MGLQNRVLLTMMMGAINVGSMEASNACTLCQDGSPIPHPEAFVEETEQTCREMAEEASYYSDPVSCRYYHRYGNECGCSNSPPAETFCQLCQDGSPIPDGSLLLDGYSGNCDVLQADAAWNLWSTLEANAVDDNEATCDYYHHAGKLCGCSNNVPPPNGCKLCLDGSPPLLPNKVVTPENAAEETCEAFSLYTQYLQVQGTEECTKSQSVVGSYCGCTETPISDVPVACDYCPPGLVTKEAIAAKIDFVADTKIFYFRDAACIKIAMLATEFDFPCDSVPDAFVNSCCEPATELLGPEVFIQGAVEREPEVVDDVRDQQDEITAATQEMSSTVAPDEEDEKEEKYVIDTSTVGVQTATHGPSQITTKLPLRGSTQDSHGGSNTGRVDSHKTQPPSSSTREPNGWVHQGGATGLVRDPIAAQPQSKDVNWDEFVFLYVSSAPRSSWDGGMLGVAVTILALMSPLVFV